METYKMDLIKTPSHSFIMVNVKGAEADSPHAIFPSGKFAFETTPLSYKMLDQVVLGHISDLASQYPNAKIMEFYASCSLSPGDWRLHISQGTLSELLREDNLWRLAEEYAKRTNDIVKYVANPQDLRTTPERAYECVKKTIPVAIWKQLIKQQGKNFLFFDKAYPCHIKLQNGELWLADDAVAENNGHGQFEIQIFEILSSSTREGRAFPIYPVETLELRLKDPITGAGCWDFDSYWDGGKQDEQKRKEKA